MIKYGYEIDKTSGTILCPYCKKYILLTGEKLEPSRKKGGKENEKRQE
ncbi:MAG: hypothetical protein ACTSYD_02615 [Candidatus Heimdallarchaeaceae archaeon]